MGPQMWGGFRMELDRQPIAYLLVDDLYSSDDMRIPIYPNEQFFLGRHTESCRHSWDDPRISNKHLRIHCIQFDDSIDEPIPLVYAEDTSTNGTVVTSSSGQECLSDSMTTFLRGSESSAMLLTHGDEIILSGVIQLVFMEARPQKLEKIEKSLVTERKEFSDRYVITNRKLGVGGQGAVYVALSKASWRQLACKVVTLKRPIEHLREDEAEEVDRAFREFNLLKNLSHPNIITIEKVFWSSNTIYIFQELLTGGDLFSYIEFKGNKVVDVEAALIARQILEAVKYLHAAGIVHRDLKPDNILLASLDEGARIVLTDFGSSRFLPQAQQNSNCPLPLKARMFTVVGTTEFAAPEVHGKNPRIKDDDGYSLAADMWSFGCILAALLSGDTLFVDRHQKDYHTNQLKHVVLRSSECNLDILDNDTIWKTVGKRPKDLIRKLLVLDETDRLTAAQALAHPWFTNECYAAELDALYDRAIGTWQSRKSTSPLVERLKLVTTSNPRFSPKSTSPKSPQTTMKAQLSMIEEITERADYSSMNKQVSEYDIDLETQQGASSPLAQGIGDVYCISESPIDKAKRQRESSKYDEESTDFDMQDASIGDAIPRYGGAFKKSKVSKCG